MIVPAHQISPVSSPMRPPSVSRTGEDAVLEFEALVLGLMADDMLPDGEDGFMGGGAIAAHWKSLMAGEIGKAIARSGVLGLGAVLEPGHES